MIDGPVTPNDTLQSLYTLIGDVELVHVISGARTVTIDAAIVGEKSARALTLPAGHYLVIKVIDPPVARRGLFGVIAPKT